MKDYNSFINTFYGVLFVGFFALIATFISEFSFFKNLAISPLVIGIVLGVFYANSLKHKFSDFYQKGIVFSTKYVLRFGIILYGFRLTFQNLQEIGFNGVFIAFCIVFFTFIFGYIIGTKVLKLDYEITILCSAGSSICGAAAVMATQSVLKNEAYKSVIAVSFVVIFGTTAMFLYPFLYKLGIFDLSTSQMGVYIGATLHEVAHVVGTSATLGEAVAKDAIIVKMIRVIFLVPFLILLSFWLIKAGFHTKNEKTKVVIPWFAIIFILVIIFNSFDFLEKSTILTINFIDIFTLTMAMTALGMETSFEKFKDIGMKPFFLSLILFIWLVFVGYFLVKFFF